MNNNSMEKLQFLNHNTIANNNNNSVESPHPSSIDKQEFIALN